VSTSVTAEFLEPVPLAATLRQDQPELRYYVKGGKESHGQHGFIFSNANWDPYPLGNQIEAFTIALANMDVAIMLRQRSAHCENRGCSWPPQNITALAFIMATPARERRCIANHTLDSGRLDAH
jgi:hypothetical protein